jgi:hypothetical protein
MLGRWFWLIQHLPLRPPTPTFEIVGPPPSGVLTSSPLLRAPLDKGAMPLAFVPQVITVPTNEPPPTLGGSNFLSDIKTSARRASRKGQFRTHINRTPATTGASSPLALTPVWNE